METAVFSEVFHLAPTPLAILQHSESTYRISQCNEAFSRLFACRQNGNESLLDDLLGGSRILEEEVNKGLDALQHSGTPFSIQIGMQQDTDLWDESDPGPVGSLKFDLLKQQNGILISFKDDTLEVVKRRNQFIKRIIEKLPIGIAVNAIDTGQALYVGELFGKTYGWAEAAFEGVDDFFEKVYPNPVYRAETKEQIMGDIVSGDPERMQWTGLAITTSEGKTKIVNAKNIPVPEQNIMISTVTDVSELHEKNEELNKAKNIQEAIINCTDDHIWAFDKEQRLLAINNSFSEFMTMMNGKTPVIGNRLTTDQVSDDIQSRWDREFLNALNGTKVSFVQEGWNEHAGMMEYAQVNMNPMRGANDEIIGVACFSKNITNERRSHLMLEETTHELEQILHSSVDVICTVDGNGIFRKVSAASMHMWGYEPVEVEGQKCLDFVPESDRVNADKMLQLLKSTAISQQFEGRIVHKNGSEVLIDWSGVWTAATNTIYLIARDAALRLRYQEVLQTERKRYEKLFQSVPSLVLAVKPVQTDNGVDFEFEIANSETHRITRRKELIGRRVREVFPELEKHEIHDLMQQVMLTGSTIETNEMLFSLNIPGEGSMDIYIDIAIAPNKSGNGGTEGVFIFAVDQTEQVKARKQLEDANQRYEYVARSTFDALWDWDFNENTIKWSEAFGHIFGHKPEAFQTDFDFWADNVHPEDRDRAVNSLKYAIESDAENWMEIYRFKKADGNYARVIDRGVMVRSKKGEAMRMVGALQDITRISKLETLLTRTSEIARIGAWEYFPSTKVIETSEVLQAMLGLDPDTKLTLAGLKRLIIGTNAKKTFDKGLKQAIEDGKDWDNEYQILHVSGEPFWVRSRGTVEMAEEKCHAIYASFQDIDVPMKYQLALAESRDEKNTILESIGDAFFAMDKEGKVTYWNRLAEEITDVKKESILGKKFIDAYPFPIPEYAGKMYQKFTGQNSTLNFEFYSERKKLWLEVSAYSAKSGYSVYFRDITDRMLAEKNLQQINEKLSEQTKALTISNRELEQFAYVASHDLQEPLRMVTGFLTQLEKKYSNTLDERAQRYIYFAVDGAQRMRNIIMDLLEYSRVGRGNQKPEEVHLKKLVMEITILNQQEMEAKAARINYQELPVITTYKSPIRQALQNLLSNALKYSDPERPPVIDIKFTEFEDSWQISVVDNGIGIDPAYFEKIFIIFQRLHTRDQYSGTGMGLALTKKIVENLGGRIWVESVLGEGSTFSFALPKV